MEREAIFRQREVYVNTEYIPAIRCEAKSFSTVSDGGEIKDYVYVRDLESKRDWSCTKDKIYPTKEDAILAFVEAQEKKKEFYLSLIETQEDLLKFMLTFMDNGEKTDVPAVQAVCKQIEVLFGISFADCKLLNIQKFL